MIESRRASARNGYVMLTTLWVMSIASVVAMGGALLGRESAMAGATRVELERARWTAVGCERRAQAAVDAALAAAELDEGDIVWRTLPAVIVHSPLIQSCSIRLEDVGQRIDVNSARADMIAAALAQLGQSAQAAELAKSLRDWITVHGALVDLKQLHAIAGFESVPGLDSVFTVEPGHVSLASAPVPVLVSVPGIDEELAEHIADLQLAGNPPPNLGALIQSVSQTSSETLALNFADAAHATTADPDAWIIHVSETRGKPAVSVELAWRIIRAGDHCVVASTRSTL